jgi:hypothetical protein
MLSEARSWEQGARRRRQKQKHEEEEKRRTPNIRDQRTEVSLKHRTPNAERRTPNVEGAINHQPRKRLRLTRWGIDDGGFRVQGSETRLRHSFVLRHSSFVISPINQPNMNMIKNRRKRERKRERIPVLLAPRPMLRSQGLDLGKLIDFPQCRAGSTVYTSHNGGVVSWHNRANDR